MPTIRLMQFSPSGGSEETFDDNGKRSTQPLQGVSSTHFLKLIEDRGQIGFWASDFATNHVTTSIGLYRLFGIDPSIPLGREDLLRIMHPDDRPSHHDMHEVLHSGHAIEREFRIIRPDGTMRWLQNKAEVIVDAEGRPVRGVGLMIDITDQRAARQSVEEGWHRYKTLIKAMAVMELRMKPNGDVVNRDGWYELTGQTEAEAAGWGWLDAVHPDDRELTRAASMPSLATGEMRVVDHRIRCADGQYRWFLARTAPIMDPDGTIREWVGALLKTSDYGAGTTLRVGQVATCLEASHIRAARALLNWTINDLAVKAGISISSVRRLETDAGHTVRDHVLHSVYDTFKGHGITFTSGPRKGDISIRFSPT